MNVSIAMATYNGARYLQAQLDSLARQTVLPAELVVCDDQSCDGTPELIEKFAQTAPFPVVLKENPHRLHFADNFLQAADLCTSDYVAFCDQDDVWHSQKISTVTQAFETSDACLVAHNASVIDADGRVVGELGHIDRNGMLTGAELHPWGFFLGFTCTFKKQLLSMIPGDQRPFDIIDPTRRLAHDRWVAFLASIYGDVCVLDDELAGYRYHGSNASGWMKTPRGLTESIAAARLKFGYHLLKQLRIAQSLVELMGGLLSSPSRLREVPSPPRLLEMLAYWRIYAERCAARYTISKQDSPQLRAQKLGLALLNHAYRDAVNGSISYRALALDLVVSLIARPGQSSYAESLLSTSQSGATSPERGAPGIALLSQNQQRVATEQSHR